MAETPLFDEKTRRKLEQLMLHASRVRSGAIKGDRRSIKRGTSVEFADYRNYAPGDDLRRLDWNIYARLERPLTKVYEDEEDLAVHLVLDTSASMDYPTESEFITAADLNEQHKFNYARRLLAGLGYISLNSNDRLTITAIGKETHYFGAARGRGYGAQMLNFVGKLKAEGMTDLNAALKNYALRATRPGLLLLISDLFAPNGIMDGVNLLLSKGYEVAVIHTLAPQEIEPPLMGDLRLIDSETGAGQEVSIDGNLRDLYMRRVAAWREGIRADFSKRGVHYVPVNTGNAWEKVILYDMRRLNLVR